MPLPYMINRSGPIHIHIGDPRILTDPRRQGEVLYRCGRSDDGRFQVVKLHLTPRLEIMSDELQMVSLQDLAAGYEEVRIIQKAIFSGIGREVIDILHMHIISTGLADAMWKGGVFVEWVHWAALGSKG